MPEKIQRQPRGLLGLLGVKSLGIAPDLLADEVRPVLRMEELYLNERRMTVRSTSVAANMTGGASVATFTVPTDQAWFLKSMGIEVVTWTAVPEQVAFLNIRHQQEPSNNFAVPIFTTGPWVIDDVSDRIYDGHVFEEPLLALPGDVFFLYNLKLLQDAVPATVQATCTLKLRYTPIQL